MEEYQPPKVSSRGVIATCQKDGCDWRSDIKDFKSWAIADHIEHFNKVHRS